MPNKIVLVTLANGKQCRHLIPLLLENTDLIVRAFVHSDMSAKQIRKDFNNSKNLDPFVGDLLQPNDITQAMENVYSFPRWPSDVDS